MNAKLTLFVLFILVFIPAINRAAEYGKISGRVIDSVTNLPVEGVNIYIANSFRGASTDRAGNYVIEQIPLGRYTLIFSHISYINEQQVIRLDRGVTYRVNKFLTPKPIEFPEIEVADMDDEEWRDNFELFELELIGYGDFADQTRITNPYAVTFGKNEKGNLTASCNGPLVIINKALGYQILYFLKYFEVDFDYTKYSGVPVFDTLAAENNKELKRWEENRLKAYAGSLRHFLTALSETYAILKEQEKEVTLEIDLDDKTDDGYKYDYEKDYHLTKQGFKAYLQPASAWGLRSNPLLYPLYPDSILTEGKYPNELYLFTDNIIEAKYLNEYNEKISIDTWQKYDQLSWIKFHADTIAIDKRGRYHDEFMVQTFGYWSRERLADMLPFEYRVPDKVLENVSFK